MSNTCNTTPIGVANTPIHTATAVSAPALAAFTAITELLLVMIEAHEDAGPFGDTALSGLADDAADAEARCKTAVSHFLMQPMTDPVLQTAAVQINGLLHDLGDAPDMLARYPHVVAQLADLCTLRAVANNHRGIIDMHNICCAKVLHDTAVLLTRMVESDAALSCVMVHDDPALSISEMLSV
jgi:hypothetical protein